MKTEDSEQTALQLSNHRSPRVRPFLQWKVPIAQQTSRGFRLGMNAKRSGGSPEGGFEARYRNSSSSGWRAAVTYNRQSWGANKTDVARANPQRVNGYRIDS